MSLIAPQTLRYFGETSIAPVLEFTAIAFIAILFYLGIHEGFSHIRPVTKALVAMFLGATAYTLGKMVVLVLFAGPLFNGF